MGLLPFIQQHWTEWMFAAISSILGYLYRDVRNRLKEEQEKSAAIAEGVKGLLRESIVQNYNKFQHHRSKKEALTVKTGNTSSL